MLASGYLPAKDSAIQSLQLPFIFINICQHLHYLDSLRIVEKIARPISISDKAKIINQTNLTLQTIQKELQNILQLSSKFKDADFVFLQHQNVSANSWKNGVRKVQVKLSQFYEIRTIHFTKINECMKLGFELVRIEQKSWAKDCFSKMSSFCICG